MNRHAALLLFAIGLSPQVASADLIAFYTFEGNANDISGNGNDGTVNGATLTSAGFEGQAYTSMASTTSSRSPSTSIPVCSPA